MRDAWLGRLFARFRDRGDGRALAAVFDATARDLAEVAAHLVPTLDQAEDLVQITFQRAIEHAPRYDEARSLKGWLYGILSREAKQLARRELRPLDAGALLRSAGEAPHELLAARELPAAVQKALARVAPPYREVLQGVLVEEQTTREVARQLARSPGTVRVQLQRGLERLRSELVRTRTEPPAPTRLAALLGLAGVRTRVLGQAGFAPGSIPPAGLGFSALQSLSVVGRPALFAGAGVLCLVGFGALHLAREEGPRPGPEELLPMVDTAEGGEAPANHFPRLDAAEFPASAPMREPLVSGPVSAVPERAQIVGRVLDERGKPVPGAHVVAEGQDHYGWAETNTDADGSFVFAGLVAGRAWHVYLDDGRFARMYWKTTRLELAQERELPLEVQLVARAAEAVRGRVVDLAGRGVGGVELTLAREWLRGEAEPQQVNLTESLDRATSGPDGSFVFERCNAGRLTLVLAHAEFARALHEVVAPAAGLELRLEPGLELVGLVRHAGEPLPGVSVSVRSTRSSLLTMGDHTLVTDAEGRFRLAHVAPVRVLRLSGVSTLVVEVDGDGWASDRYQVFESARPDLPFVELEARRDDGDARAVIELGRDHRGEALAAGLPVGNGAIEVRFDPSTERPARIALHGDPLSLAPFERSLRSDSDRTRFEALPAGRYRLEAEDSRARAWIPLEFTLADGERLTVELELAPENP